jgi:hypothetical protein
MTVHKRSVLPFLAVLVLLGLTVAPVLSASDIPAKDTWGMSASSIHRDTLVQPAKG